MIAGVSLAGKTLLQQLELTSAATPHALAVLAPGREPLSVSQLERTVKTMARDLYGLGYGAGDRIAVAAPPWGAESAVGGLGVAVTATVVTVDSRSTADELESWFGRTGADAVMVHTKLDSPARAVAVRMGLPLIDLIPREGAPAGSVTVGGEAVRQGEAPRAVSPDDLIVIGGTSGTTGRPKAIGITQREMTRSLGAFRFDAGSSRGLAVAPLGGLTTFRLYVASLAFGSSIVFPSALEPSRLLKWLLEFEIDQFAGNRPVLEALLAAARAHPELVARCGLKKMLAGGSEIPPNLIAEAERTFGAPFTYVYAMTETGPIAMLPPGSTGERPGSVGKPMVELRIVSETGAPVPQGAAGEVEVKGPRVIEEYFDDPEATQNAFHDGWFRTGDVGYLDADGYLYISGRVKEMINRGGDKVLPPEVDDALMSHPAVADAAAFPIPHRTLGEEVAAAVVWTDGELAEQELRDYLLDRLAPNKVPRRIVAVDEIPRHLGKVQRAGMAKELGLGPYRKATPDAAQPRPGTERQLADLWRHLLELEADVALDDDFFELGGDSLLAVEMQLQVENAFGVILPQSGLIQSGRLVDVARAVDSAKAASPASSLVPVQPNGTRRPLFWIHGGDGTVLRVGTLAFHMGSDQPVYAFQPQGVDGNSPVLNRIEDMVDHYRTLMRQVQPEGPYALGGHSLGGLIAFEMARSLEALGERADPLVLIDTDAPGRSAMAAWTEHNLRLWRMLGARERIDLVRGFLAKRFRPRRLERRPPPRDAHWRGAWAVTPAIATAFSESFSDYTPGVYSGSALFFKAEQTTQPRAAARWQHWISGPIQVINVPGNHVSCFSEPAIGVLAGHLRRRLESPS
jgi:acyl-CoA synthetase (AMP-forming)/AMP-acid ligase II/thioesterase domain-containing protein/acyl carrier protein